MTLSSGYVDKDARSAVASNLVRVSRKFAIFPRLVSHRKTSLTAPKLHTAYERSLSASSSSSSTTNYIRD